MSERNWHDNDSFWEALEPFMFTERRWEGTPEEVNLLLDLVSLNAGDRVCDVGCGPGRFSLELTRRGFRVTGIDRTKYFLASGRRRAAEEGLDLEFIQSDMRSFVRPGTFDCAISIYTTFGYFEDPAENLQALKNIHRSLKADGVLVMEMMGKEVLARMFLERGWDQVGDGFLLQERKVSKDWSWMENRWILISGQNRTEYNVSHWIYSATELKQMLLSTGFGRVNIFGDFKGDPYDHNAQRLVAVAYKQ